MISIELEEYPGYRVCADGRIQTEKLKGSKIGSKTGVWRDMKPYLNARCGYLYVDLKGEKRKNWALHCLVARTFHGPCPSGLEVRHKDGNRFNNRPDNLCYGTRSQNMQDAVRHGTIKRGVKQELSKLDDQKVMEMLEKFQLGRTAASLAREYGVSSSVVSTIINGKAWKHVPRPDGYRNPVP